MSDEYIYKSKLKERGWTDKMIEKFAGEPDKVVQNPFYRSKQSFLYLSKRIEKIEKYKRFIKMKEESAPRQASAQKAAQKAVKTKTQKSIEYVETMQIEIPTYKRETLERLAYNSWLEHQELRGNYFAFEFEFEYVQEDTMKRWCINYLRHECTEYDERLYRLFGKVGVQKAHDILKDKITKAIYAKYEWLK